MINICQGTTANIEVSLYNNAGTFLSTLAGTGVLLYRRGGTVSSKSGTITDGVLAIAFTPAETAELKGEYDIEVKAKDSSTLEIDCVIHDDTMNVTVSLDPDWSI